MSQKNDGVPVIFLRLKGHSEASVAQKLEPPGDGVHGTPLFKERRLLQETVA